MAHQNATLADVAAAAGVSLATASRVLNGSTRKVSTANRELVVAAAQRLRYTPNVSAQAVAKGSSPVVALLVTDISDPYFSAIAAGTLAEADRHGLVVTIAVTERDPQRELEVLRALRGQRPRVLVMVASRRASETTEEIGAELEAFTRGGGRAVLFGAHDYDLPSIRIDNEGGTLALSRALAERGYRRAVVLAGPEGLRTSDQRLAGYLQGPLEIEVVRTSFDRAGGTEAMATLLARDVHPELVLCTNDVMAIGALGTLRRHGIEPGTQIALAGFDDIVTAADVHPGLSTVRVDLAAAGRAALALALTASDARATTRLATEVVLRDSTPIRS